MANYILTYLGAGRPPAEAVRRIRDAAHVVDEVPDQAYLVQGEDHEVRALSDALPNWSCSPEGEAEIPDPRPHPAGPP